MNTLDFLDTLIKEEYTVPIQSGKVILTKGLLNFKDVIEKYPTSFIYISTYSLFEIDTTLIDYLRDLSNGLNTEIVIVTNIPKYKWEDVNLITRKDINDYLERLNPENFGSNYRCYINKKNHSKMIITDKIAYIGSANYTIASKKNLECGVLFENPQDIKNIKEKIWPEVIGSAEIFAGPKAILFWSQIDDISNLCNEMSECLSDVVVRDLDVKKIEDINKKMKRIVDETSFDLFKEIVCLKNELKTDIDEILAYLESEDIQTYLNYPIEEEETHYYTEEFNSLYGRDKSEKAWQKAREKVLEDREALLVKCINHLKLYIDDISYEINKLMMIWVVDFDLEKSRGFNELDVKLKPLKRN